jgi:hypothetical protein
MLKHRIKRYYHSVFGCWRTRIKRSCTFVTQHQWAKEVGLVLNFEARGSSGPSYMLMETNAGNAGLVKNLQLQMPLQYQTPWCTAFIKCYLTILTWLFFREQGNKGSNFAFIDDHYNYHTAQDDSNHLDKNTLAHQGSYLMPLLKYFKCWFKHY